MTRILSLDDDLPMLELIGLILQRAGYDHVYTTSSSDALAILRREPVDLFTQDIMRPDIDGWEFYRLLKSEPLLRNVPVLMVTCQAQRLDRGVGAPLAPTDGYLTKPFGPSELLAAVEAVLRQNAKSPPTEEERLQARLRREAALRRRAQLLAEVVAGLGNVTLSEHLVVINGRYGCYEVSLGSGCVVRRPGRPICIVPDHTAGPYVGACLPFEDTDNHTERLLSIILMFAADYAIRDDTILRQLKEQPNDCQTGRGRDQNSGRLVRRAGTFDLGIPA